MKGLILQPLRFALPYGLAMALCCASAALASAETVNAGNEAVCKRPELNEEWMARVKVLRSVVRDGNVARKKMHAMQKQFRKAKNAAKGNTAMLSMIEIQHKIAQNAFYPEYRETRKNGRHAYRELRDMLRDKKLNLTQLDNYDNLCFERHEESSEGALFARNEQVGDIKFDDSASALRIRIVAPNHAAYSVKKLGDGRAELRVDGAVLPQKLNKHYDTAALNSTLLSLDAFDKNGTAHFVARTRRGDGDNVYRDGNDIVWEFEREGLNVRTTYDRRREMMVSAAEPRGTKATAKSDDFAKSYGARTTLKGTEFSNQRITLDVRDVEIQDLLRLISDEINVSIVSSPDVKGTVTLSLKSVPLDQALDIILRMNDLGMKYEGKVIWVAKADVFREEEKRALEAAMVREKLEPLEVRLIPVNYATASTLQSNIKALLSERGSLEIDERTNTLVVKDVAANLNAVEVLVNSLDTQTPQILIEARIVETQANFTKEIGVQWGGDGIASAATGNATGIAFPSSVGIAGGSTSEHNFGTSATPNFAVNLPASVGTGSGGALGMSFGSIGGAVNINLRLSALEEKGFLKIVSAPRVMTLDNVKASIEQGTSIPISVVSAAGAQTVFFDAKLNLEVTPHATRDGNVFLKIDVQKNEPDFGNKGASGDPSIIRKEAHTQLLIQDGDTTVIGGIYTRNTGQSVKSVPFLGSIPILGYFFRNTSETDNRTELLIFITPRIINKKSSLAAAGPGSFIPPAKDDGDKK